MKIVCISCFDAYNMRMENIIDYFDNAGNDVKYLYADYNHLTKEYDEKIRKHGVVIHVPSYKNNISLNRLFSHFIFSKQVGNYLKRNKPSVVYCMVPPNFVVKEISKYKNCNKVKVIYDIYDFWPESIPIKGISRHLAHLPFRMWASIRNKGLKQSDLITTVSKDAKQKVRKLIQRKGIPIEVVYPVIKDTNRPEYCFRKNSNMLSLCFLGNINYITDTDLMFRLLFELRKHTGLRIHFIGGGLNFNNVVEKIKKMDIEVVSHGTIFDISEKNKVFAMCDLGLNLPKKEINSSMSLKSVEYLRAGLPIINTGVGDNWMMVDNYNIGFNIFIQSIQKIAKTIAGLSTEDLNIMHQNCISVYDNCFLGQDYEKIFEPVLLYKSL